MAKLHPEKFIWLDGKLVAWDEAHVHILTHTLHYGLGAFEGIRAYELSGSTNQGAVFRLTEHIDRLMASSKLCLINVPYSREQLIAACVETLRQNNLRNAYLRPLVFLGDGEMGLGATKMAVRVAIATYVWGSYLGDEGIKNGIRAKVSTFARSQQSALLKAKVCGQYVNSVLAKREVVLAGYDEAIMLDSSGYVAEASGENIFAVIRGRLVTPPLSAAILEGITRDSVLTIAADLGIDIVLADVLPGSKADEVKKEEAKIGDIQKRLADVERKIEDRRKLFERNSLQARILAVNSDWGFVVIDAGKASGLEQDTKLLVTRNRQTIGKISVMSVDGSRSVASIVPDAVLGNIGIAPGDSVILENLTAGQ